MSVSFSKSPAAGQYPDLNPPENPEQDQSEDKDGGWLISFVDILTLLLTLFVLLLSFSHFSQQTETRRKTAQAPAQSITHPDNPAPQARPWESPEPVSKQIPSFSVPQDIRDKVEITTTPKGVNLIIKDDVLFGEGSIDLKSLGQSVLDRIAQMLNQNDYMISVEGHTDNVPIHTAQFPSNWELSTGRASAVTRYFIQRGISVDRLRAIGYADTRPIAANDTEEGRARNRRVSLVLNINQAGKSSQAPSEKQAASTDNTSSSK
jgi:chemotaxis protein MotB